MTIHVWVTKKALTKGIRELDVRLTAQPHLVEVPPFKGKYLNRPDWHHTREAAEARLVTMHQDKIQRLEAKIAKLKTLPK